ncbi:hypothetical protein H4R33_002305 [Dimargaris cristalligena]|nr:hypothetical protein H4R33_002305 [Dimargaris cristalligena]
MSLLGCLAGLFSSPPPYLSLNEAQALPLNEFVNRSVESAPHFVSNPAESQSLVQIYQRHLQGQADLRSVTAGLFQTAQNVATTDADRQRLQWVHMLMDSTMNQVANLSQGPQYQQQPPMGGGGNANDHSSQQPPRKSNNNNNNNNHKKQGQQSFAAVVGQGHSQGTTEFHPAPTMAPATSGIKMATYFFPSEPNFKILLNTLNSARNSLDVCVFSLTDDDLANALIAAKKRGVQVRLISDDDQCSTLGSDVQRLGNDHGIPTRVDNNPSHMHHKFAIVDNQTLISGSYNWTKAARKSNRENIMITDSPDAVNGFRQEFNRLWQEYS